MRKLTPSEKLILERLIFPESFDVIQEETKLQFGEIRDDLINLMSYRLVQVVNVDKSEPNDTSFYDADNMKEHSYRITKAGLKQLSKTK